MRRLVEHAAEGDRKKHQGAGTVATAEFGEAVLRRFDLEGAGLPGEVGSGDG